MGATQSVIGGFRIFRVAAGSPAAEAGLLPYFDFIVEAGGRAMTPHHEVFTQAIKEHENTRVKLVVYSILTQALRDVYVTPRQWGGQGTGLLGATVRWDVFEEAEQQSVRVLEVFPNSPAALAGLEAQHDYLLGTTTGVALTSLDALKSLLGENAAGLPLVVYNTLTQSLREVNLVPNANWGGQGVLGADIRTGVLHRVPVISPTVSPRRPQESTPATSPTVPRPPPCTPHAKGDLAASPISASPPAEHRDVNVSVLNLPEIAAE